MSCTQTQTQTQVQTNMPLQADGNIHTLPTETHLNSTAKAFSPMNEAVPKQAKAFPRRNLQPKASAPSPAVDPKPWPCPAISGKQPQFVHLGRHAVPSDPKSPATVSPPVTQNFPKPPSQPQGSSAQASHSCPQESRPQTFFIGQDDPPNSSYLGASEWPVPNSHAHDPWHNHDPWANAANQRSHEPPNPSEPVPTQAWSQYTGVTRRAEPQPVAASSYAQHSATGYQPQHHAPVESQVSYPSYVPQQMPMPPSVSVTGVQHDMSLPKPQFPNHGVSSTYMPNVFEQNPFAGIFSPGPVTDWYSLNPGPNSDPFHMEVLNHQCPGMCPKLLVKHILKPRLTLRAFSRESILLERSCLRLRVSHRQLPFRRQQRFKLSRQVRVSMHL